MRRVAAEVRPSDLELLLVNIDPLPQLFRGAVALPAGIAPDAHQIDGKPMAIAAAAAAAMIGAVARSLVAGCDRLPVIVAERAGDSRHVPGFVHLAKSVVELL